MENNLLVEGQAEFPEVFIISNAGLCLLSPWFPRLFNILGYLDKDHRSFKDMASKIRASSFCSTLSTRMKRYIGKRN